MATKPKTISVVAAGRDYLGIGRDASYAAAREGIIPTIRVGKLWRVPIVAMERVLESTGQRDSKSQAA